MFPRDESSSSHWKFGYFKRFDHCLRLVVPNLVVLCIQSRTVQLFVSGRTRAIVENDIHSLFTRALWLCHRAGGLTHAHARAHGMRRTRHDRANEVCGNSQIKRYCGYENQKMNDVPTRIFFNSSLSLLRAMAAGLLRLPRSAAKDGCADCSTVKHTALQSHVYPMPGCIK